MTEGCPYPIEALLPHARPMILLDRVSAFSSTFLEAELTVRPDMPFFEQGKGVGAHIALEWMAQACAAYVGLEALLANEPVRIGFLVGTRNFAARCAWFAAAETIRVRADLVFRDGETGVFDCAVHRDALEVVRAQLTLHQPRDIRAVLASQGIEFDQ
jgi:predicted hotdog family 3-hydroxylacyl-ACP dehydratase